MGPIKTRVASRIDGFHVSWTKLARGPLYDGMITPALLCLALIFAGWALASSSGVLRIDAAQAESAQPNPVEGVRKAIETLINRLRGRDMPAGIEKAEGNIEATQVD